MGQRLHILGIPGSLRGGSFNRALLRTAGELAGEDAEVEIYQDLERIPPYNEDVRLQGDPAPVQELKDRIRASDAVLIATPEYNYGAPGVLKNAIDWASRPPQETPLRFKPVGIMGASGGAMGTVRAQLALRQCFLFIESYVMLKPEMLVPRAREKFDEQLRLVDEDIREHLRTFLRELARWTRRMSHE